MTTTALLGAGIMGAAMAPNLARAGIRPTVWNRTRAKAEPLAAHGATLVDTPAEAVRDADVIITMLTDGDAVLAAMEAAAPALRPGQIWAQMSTIGVDAVAPLAAFAADHGLTFVDAPVQGTRQPAEQGALVILAAGPQDARAALAPVFDAVGKKTLWLDEDGASGAGTRLKLAAVAYGITLTSILAESLALTKALGLDPALFGEVVTGGPMDSPYLQAKLVSVLAGDFTPSFALRNAEKDTRLITEAAASANVRLDMAEAARERFRRALDQGHGDLDMSATYHASFS
ncbi:NAD(P)-dependent oxidoreductase [Actinomadura harenae]|uniref:NAD(P)-dependent oxidoreductase n=1 Tax=Actinomadura harenae TaxID=2483351 RepID=A0A3M2LU92_9ACTN|nr:NAD(P)-dependent oxidoreductase [Actinomadura harenae]RMI40676.1 NAD(P)-dependent oxidoreductase [Actinomadura harenae]